MPTFQSFDITENEDKTFSQAIIDRNTNDLPAGEVLSGYNILHLSSS